MKITFLGTGTSHGIPVIGCNCPICSSANKKNKRLRSSLLISNDDHNVLIDASIDLRQQSLNYNVTRINAVLCTHVHADHVFGIDDLRAFNSLQKVTIPLYAQSAAITELQQVFHYLFDPSIQKGGGVADIELKEIFPGKPFELFDLKITPIEIMHGKLPILGFRINNIAYLTDCSAIPENSMSELKDLDILILDALRIRPHSTHFNLEQAVDMAGKINAKKTFFTHIAHELEHKEINKSLPANMELAYDGLIINSSPVEGSV